MNKPRIIVLACLLTACQSATATVTKFDRFGGCEDIAGTKTGRWHIEVIKGRHWFVTPEGHGCYIIGINHIHDGGSNSNRHTLRHLQDWGFNCAGYGPSKWIRSQKPYFVGLRLHDAVHWLPAQRFAFLDVFGQAFVDSVDRKVQEACENNKENPFAIGYSLTDTPRYDLDISRRRRGSDWVSALRAQEGDTPGKRRYLAFLKERYGSVEALRTAYRIEDLKSFADLDDYDFCRLELTRPAIRRDDEAFIAIIAERIYRLTSKAFDRYDPKALVLSEKFKKHDHPMAVLRIAAKYTDVISVQPGPTCGPDVGQGPDESVFDLTYWQQLHEMTGKPVFICDHACSFYTPEYPRTLWHQLDSEEDAARFYDRYLRQVAVLPFMPGYMRCQYKSRYDPLRTLLKQGLLDLDGQPYKHLVRQVRLSNEAVKREVYGIVGD